jgi:hypothetical protein
VRERGPTSHGNPSAFASLCTSLSVCHQGHCQLHKHCSFPIHSSSLPSHPARRAHGSPAAQAATKHLSPGARAAAWGKGGEIPLPSMASGDFEPGRLEQDRAAPPTGWCLPLLCRARQPHACSLGLGRCNNPCWSLRPMVPHPRVAPGPSATLVVMAWPLARSLSYWVSTCLTSWPQLGQQLPWLGHLSEPAVHNQPWCILSPHSVNQAPIMCQVIVELMVPVLKPS